MSIHQYILNATAAFFDDMYTLLTRPKHFLRGIMMRLVSQRMNVIGNF